MLISRSKSIVAAGILAWLIVGGPVIGAEQRAKSPVPTSKESVKAAKSLTVGVLDFVSEGADGVELGKQVSEILTASLSGQDGITLVDRTSIDKTLREMELNLSALISADQAVHIGDLVGAKLIVTGKVFRVDQQMFMTAKVIGTETTLVEGLLVKGDKSTDVGKLALELAGRLTLRIREAGPRLTKADQSIVDPVPALREKLKGATMPTVAVRVAERHVAGRQSPAIDPAVETEIRMLLKDAGFKIVQGDEKELAKGKVEWLIDGEAFSELGGRIGNLVSCSARTEIQMKNRKTGEVVLVHRDTTRAADLSENIAGKSALQKAGRAAGIHVLQHFADALPKADARANP